MFNSNRYQFSFSTNGSNTEAAMAQYQLYCFKDHLIFLASSGCHPLSLKLKRDFKNCGYMTQEWFFPLSIFTTEIITLEEKFAKVN